MYAVCIMKPIEKLEGIGYGRVNENSRTIVDKNDAYDQDHDQCHDHRGHNIGGALSALAAAASQLTSTPMSLMSTANNATHLSTSTPTCTPVSANAASIMANRRSDSPFIWSHISTSLLATWMNQLTDKKQVHFIISNRCFVFVVRRPS